MCKWEYKRKEMVIYGFARVVVTGNQVKLQEKDAKLVSLLTKYVAFMLFQRVERIGINVKSWIAGRIKIQELSAAGNVPPVTSHFQTSMSDMEFRLLAQL